MKTKKFFFGIIIAVILLLFIDACGHLLYRLAKKEFIWEIYKQDRAFTIREFTELTNDERIITLKKNYYLSNKKFTIKIDENGFRVGSNQYYKDRDNIVFLGDSVPFGWNLPQDATVPSQFFCLIKNYPYGVINAAVPSYSLYQAVKHYGYAVNNKFPVKFVILQVMDPAPQFLRWGRMWNKKICWASKDSLVPFENNFTSFLHKYSSIYNMFFTLERYRKKLDLNDSRNFEFFKKENFSALEELYALLKEKNIALILVPTNLSKVYYAYNNRQSAEFNRANQNLLAVTGWLNKILADFASTHPGVYYFDIVVYFDKIGREGMFIDNAHLTDIGSQKEAEFIFEQLKTHHLL